MTVNLKNLIANLTVSNDMVCFTRNFESGKEATIVYCKTLCDSKWVDKVITDLLQLYSITGLETRESIKQVTSFPYNLLEKDQVHQIELAVLTGNIVVWFTHLEFGVSIPAQRMLSRQTEESNIEVSVRGPKNGFVEDIDINVGLIRKRLPDPSLCYETYIVGSKSKTKVGLLYSSEKITVSILDDIQQRLSSLENHVEELNSATQLDELILDQRNSLFPLTSYTGRADFAATSILRGRFVIVIDGLPGATIAPATLTMLLKTAEDTHLNFLSTTFGRLLRFFSLAISIFLPSFYVALTCFHQDQLPFPLLSTISLTRMGIPFSIPIEVLIILVLMDIFREAGYRLPSPIGQTITVVGGLIIGDAAIRAGLTSPTIVVVGAVSIVTGATLINQTLTGTVSVLRYFNLLLASFLGMYGFMLSFLLVLVYLSGLTSFGVPYLSPVSPINLKDVVRTIVLLPRKWKGFKPEHLKKK